MAGSIIVFESSRVQRLYVPVNCGQNHFSLVDLNGGIEYVAGNIEDGICLVKSSRMSVRVRKG